MVAAVQVTPASVRLADGRRLAYHEYGDPGGVPCVYIPGTPESGLAGACYDRAAAAAGVRLISVDKPGYGHSDPAEKRTLAGWSHDVGALVEALALDRFAVVGESGGGPHAVAVAHDHGHRVSVTVLLAGMGPGTERWVREGMRPTNVLFYYLAHYAPATLRVPLALMRMASQNERLAARMEASAPAADREAFADPEYRAREPALADAFRHGTRAAAQELAMFAQPWGFDLASVPGPVHLWHGTADVNVPIQIARVMAQALPQAVPHFVEDAGHTVGFVCRTAVMEVIAGAAAGGANATGAQP